MRVHRRIEQAGDRECPRPTEMSARSSASATQPRPRRLASENDASLLRSGRRVITDEQTRGLRRPASTRAPTVAALPDAAQLASLGCGNPTAVADLHEGETVLDLGSGGGIDVLLSARRVGPTRQGLRTRHDRRDARARPREPARGRCRERRVPQGRDRERAAARRLRRRDHLQLRDQPLRRQVPRLPRGGPRPSARRAFRRLRRRRRSRT